MKGKTVVICLLTAVLMFGRGLTAHAETYYGNQDWNVSFTEDAKMESNFKTSDLDEAVSGLQPGDNIIINLKLENRHQNASDWYMTNKVLYSLEDRSANSETGGGAYTYRLAYTDHEGTETVLFDSDTVGGEANEEGLKSATNAMEDYFYLDSLTKGQSGTLLLEVALDGETQGNDYQDTLADLQMNFAVELRDTPEAPERPGEPGTPAAPSVPPRNTIKTGDEEQPILFAALSGASALLLLFLAISRWKAGRQKGEERG